MKSQLLKAKKIIEYLKAILPNYNVKDRMYIIKSVFRMESLKSESIKGYIIYNLKSLIIY